MFLETTCMIRPATGADAGAIASIYNWYIEHTVITFELQPLDQAQVEQRLARSGPAFPWLVWETDGAVRGYAYATPFRERAAYRHSVETTIYLDRDFCGQGAGYQLYRNLLALLRQTDHHSLIAVVALPNPASVALHEKLGFAKVGHLTEIGRKFDRWVDTGYWQLNLEQL